MPVRDSRTLADHARPIRSDSQLITTAALRDATDWDVLAEQLGLPGLRRHDPRRAGATWFTNAGIPIHVVSDVLGHASFETTRAYLQNGH
jgi:integrase